MKKFLIFAVALLALSFASCSEGSEGDCSLENSEQAYDSRTGKLYTGSGKIYMADDALSTDKPVSTETMLEVGTICNGKIALALPENVDSRFLAKSEMYVNPSDVETLSSARPLRLVDNSGMYIGDLVYRTVTEKGDTSG